MLDLLEAGLDVIGMYDNAFIGTGDAEFIYSDEDVIAHRVKLVLEF